MSNRPAGDGFKFRDYLLGAGVTDATPLAVGDTMTVSELLIRLPTEGVVLETEFLLESCPFLDRDSMSLRLEWWKS